MKTIGDIEDNICKAIRSVSTDSLKGDGAWTKAIFKAVANLGSKLGFEVCSSKSDGEYDKGWLYDLVWFQNDADGQLKAVPLVLESEWGRNYSKIKYDFEKLLVARAKYKVMIFQAKGERILEYFKKMEAGIAGFQDSNQNEIYLLVCFDEDNWSFDIRGIKLKNGAHISLTF